jgi:hypothetical protein
MLAMIKSFDELSTRPMRGPLSSLTAAWLQALTRTALLAALANPAAQAAETVHVQGGGSARVLLRGYENGVFSAIAADGSQAEYKVAAVRSIEFDEPLKVSIEPRAGRSLEAALLSGLQNGMLTYSVDGKPQTKPLLTIRKIRPEVSFDRTLNDLAAPPVSRGEVVDLRSLIATGKTTVVHFHSAEVISSVRQGGYLSRLAGESQGRLVLHRIESGGWSDPILQQNGVKSLPQFWFYSPAGQLVLKLTERFTEADIDDSLAKAGCKPIRRR